MDSKGTSIARLTNANRWIAELPFYFGWVQMVAAAFAMVGTLPGRTQGLGLITEPLLKDLKLDRVQYAEINLWATLIGALFAIGIGRVIDRIGSRIVLTTLAVLLGAVVLGMASAHNQSELAVYLTLTRGLGQSALSVASLALVGKWFTRHLNMAMGIYSVVLSMGFMVAFPVIGSIVTANSGGGWRVAWAGIGWALLLGLAPLMLLVVRPTPESCSLTMEGERVGESTLSKENEEPSNRLIQALASPAFWVIGIASAVYGLIASGIALFNESILAERGFPYSIYYSTLVITALTSLLGNFLGGWLTEKRPLRAQHRLMGVSMALFMVALLALTQVRNVPQIMAIAVVMGIAGGFVIVIFFAYWAKAFGRTHLGQIQGVAQALTVVASAVGPLLLAQCVTLTGSYAGAFYILAGVVGVLGLASWFVPVPTAPREER